MAKAPPFCINCKHAHLTASPAASKVMASDYVCDAVFDIVTGEQLSWKCQNARGDVMVCGRDGKLFEPISAE